MKQDERGLGIAEGRRQRAEGKDLADKGFKRLGCPNLSACYNC